MAVIAISTDQGSDEKARTLVKSYVDRKKLTFINLLDPKSSAAAQYGVRGIPMNVFINPQNHAVAFASGYRKWDSKEGFQMIEQLLSSAKSTKKGK
jgi:peroxiredoxin